MLNLYYFESLYNSIVICLGYKISPTMMGIQDGYDKNFHIECIEYYEKFDSLWLFWDMKMVILEPCSWVVVNLRELVLKFVIPVACTYGEPLCDEVGAWFIYWLPSLCVEVGIARWLTPTNPSPRSMRVVLFFMTKRFLQ